MKNSIQVFVIGCSVIFYCDVFAQAGQAAPTYKDSYLTEVPQKMEPEIEDRGPYRQWYVDTTAVNTGTGIKLDTISSGIRWDVENYGIWSLAINKKNGGFSQASSDVVYFRQLKVTDFPTSGGGDAQFALGHTRSPLLRVAEKGVRFFIPAQSMDGVVVDMQDKSSRWFIAAGEAGQIGGAYGGSGFEGSNKAVLSVGYEKEFAGYLAGIQSMIVKGGNGEAGSLSIMPSLEKEVGGIKFHGQAVFNDNDKKSFGVWGSGDYKNDAKKYTFGVFHFEPSLKWGDSALQENEQGWHFRYSEQTKRWGTTANIEQVKILSESEITTYGQIGGRYQLDTKTNLNGMIAAKAGKSPGWQVQGAVDKKISIGNIRGQLDHGSWDGSDNTQASLEYTPNLETNLKISTELSVGRSVSIGNDSNKKLENWRSIGVTAGMDVDDIRFEGSAKTTFWNSRKRSDSFQLSSIWQINESWSLAASANWQNGGTELNWDMSPLATSKTKANQSFWVTLKYQDSVGELVKYGPSGSVDVMVFFDENGNGKRDFGEKVLKNIAVTLDNRQTAQTDDFGVAFFSGVPTGQHKFNISPSEIPLPWQMNDNAPVFSNVDVREKVKVLIPLIK